MNYYPISSQQRDVWLSQNRTELYSAQCIVLLPDTLDAAALKRSLDICVTHHEILRTGFHRVTGMRVPMQVVTDSAQIDLRSVDLSDVAGQELALRLLTSEETNRITDLSKPSLLRFALAKVSGGRQVLVLTAPSLVCDGRSLLNLVQEIVQNVSSELSLGDAGAAVQYAQYCEWQSSFLNSSEAQRGREHWREDNALRNGDATLPFEAEAHQNAFHQGACSLDIDVAHLRHLGSDGALFSLESVVLTCWFVLLSRNTGDSKLVVHTTFDGRTDPALDSAVGLFERSLPISYELDADAAFEHLAASIHAELENAACMQDSFEPPAEPSIPSFAFRFEQWPSWFENATCKPKVLGVSVRLDRTKLLLSCMQTANSLRIELRYNSALFQRDDIERLAAQFKTLFDHASGNLHTPVKALPLINENPSKVGKRRAALNKAESRRCVHVRIQNQARLTPDATAVVCQDRSLSYSELDTRATRVAGILRNFRVGPERTVAICVERSIDVVTAILGVLKAGAAYVPLEPEWPAQRLETILEKAQPAVVIADHASIQRLANFSSPVISIDHRLEITSGQAVEHLRDLASPDNAAYVMFTSGSTGDPKGVVVEHAQLDSYIDAVVSALDLPNGGQYALVSTFAADLGNTVLFSSLCTGGCVHIIPREMSIDPGAFSAYVSEQKIDVLKIVPSHLSALLSGTNPRNVLPRKRLILGGEPLSWTLADRINRLRPECVVFNHYGPTETTVGVATQALDTATRDLRRTVPIGKPLQNAEFYVLDECMREVPIWISGELYVGGSCVARGYLNEPDLTASKFLPNPFGEGRLYKTGDRVRRLPDDTFEFLSRVDDQVKINGFRVEPGEVQTILAQHPYVREAFVAARPDDTPAGNDQGDPKQRLIAYVVLKSGNQLPIEHLRTFMRERLPEYMVPANFVVLDALPLTSNGKVDRRMLPSPAASADKARSNGRQPRTPFEVVVAGIWRQVLGREDLSIEDNFFDVGGDSLSATQVISRLRRAFECELSIRDFFDSPNLGALASKVAELSLEATDDADIDNLLLEIQTEPESQQALSQQRRYE